MRFLLLLIIVEVKKYLVYIELTRDKPLDLGLLPPQNLFPLQLLLQQMFKMAFIKVIGVGGREILDSTNLCRYLFDSALYKAKVVTIPLFKSYG